MSELLGRAFLKALQDAGRQLIANPTGSRSVSDALEALVGAAEAVTSGSEEIALTIADDAFYLGSEMMPHTSTEFDGMMRDLQSRGIDSVTLISGATRRDLADLAALVAGASSDLPADGSIRVNERPMAPSDLHRRNVSDLRRSYADSLNALRSMSGGRRLEMDAVASIVSGFLGADDDGPGSSLMLATVHNHDETTYYHSVNVCLLSLEVGRALGLGDDRLVSLGVSALLHDLGRVVISERALQKEGRLTNEDWAEVRLHPQEGALAILAAGGRDHETAAAVALEHHVRLDGDGYPDVGGREPHPFSRIVAIADAYDAITSPRPYRPARTPNEALRAILDGASKAYDPDMVRAFLGVMGIYPPGSLLRLDGGQVVVVIPGDGSLQAVVVRDVDGTVVGDPHPMRFAESDVAEQLLADEVGIDPGSLVELVAGVVSTS